MNPLLSEFGKEPSNCMNHKPEPRKEKSNKSDCYVKHHLRQSQKQTNKLGENIFNM